MTKLKIGIIGLGGIAQIAHLPILSKMQDVEIISVCDTDFSKTKYIASKYQIKNYFSDVDKFLSNENEMDAVIIATPTDTHKDIAIKSLEANKDIFVERPIARNYLESQKIADAAKKYKKRVMVGMNSRFGNDAMIQRSFVRANEIGEVFYVKTGWIKPKSSDNTWMIQKEKAGGGVFLDNGVVMLDIGLWMLNFPEVKSVSAVNYYHNTKSVEDSNFTLIKFKNNAILTIETSWSLLREKEYFYCNVFGKDGSACINPLRIHKKIGGRILDITPKNIEIPPNMYKKSYENELKHFVGALKGLHKMLSTENDALTRMKIVEAIYKSAKTGKEVIFK